MLLIKKGKTCAGEMATWVKMLAAETHNRSLILRDYMAGKNQSLQTIF